ncbi:hypothetical protein [Streptomyces sp. NPDC001348]
MSDPSASPPVPWIPGAEARWLPEAGPPGRPAPTRRGLALPRPARHLREQVHAVVGFRVAGRET